MNLVNIARHGERTRRNSQAAHHEQGDWWAAFSVWRADRRLFGRIATAAREQLVARRLAAGCTIEFVVRDDIETFSSVDAFERAVSLQALRSFRNASIVVGGGPVTVEVGFRRGRHGFVVRRGRENAPPPRGVFVRVVAKDPGLADAAKDVRDAVAKVVGRGVPRWSTTEAGRGADTDLYRGLLSVARWRASPINNCIFIVMLAVALRGADALHTSELGAVAITGAMRFIFGFATATGTAFTDLFLPTIEVADATTGARIARAVVGFVVTGVGAGILAALLAKGLGL